MEERIKRMESALLVSELRGISGTVEEPKEEKNSSDRIEIQAELSNNLSNLVIDSNGSPTFIGTWTPKLRSHFIVTISC